MSTERSVCAAVANYKSNLPCPVGSINHENAPAWRRTLSYIDSSFSLYCPFDSSYCLYISPQGLVCLHYLTFAHSVYIIENFFRSFVFQLRSFETFQKVYWIPTLVLYEFNFKLNLFKIYCRHLSRLFVRHEPSWM